MKEMLLTVKAVKSVHSLHLWALTLGQSLVSVHLAIGSRTQNKHMKVKLKGEKYKFKGLGILGLIKNMYYF